MMFPKNPSMLAEKVHYKGGRRSRSKRGGNPYPPNPSLFAAPVNSMGGRRSRRGGYSFPQTIPQTAAPAKHMIPYNSHGGKRSKRGGVYRAFEDGQYDLQGRGPSITGAKFPGTTAQPHHWVGKAQRWVGPSGNPAFLH